MKRLILCLSTILLALSVNAQITENIKFLGIPIDGKKADMISAIKNKGFEYIGDDYLSGDFNGNKSQIFVHTNRNIVDRICVFYANTVDEAQIKIDFNNLLRQFQNNEKYVEFVENEFIPDDEDISYEISVHKKRYDVSFHPKPELTDEIILAIKAKKESMTDEEYESYQTSWLLEQYDRGIVWFTITEYGYNKYGLTIYYDNERNRSHGEDL